MFFPITSARLEGATTTILPPRLNYQEVEDQRSSCHCSIEHLQNRQKSIFIAAIDTKFTTTVKKWTRCAKNQYKNPAETVFNTIGRKFCENTNFTQRPLPAFLYNTIHFFTNFLILNKYNNDNTQFLTGKC
jgi:hypothetical protein